jgi:phosphocarrier protein FPr/phosphocarrier protein
MSNVILVAPLQGWSTPLDEIPDPVFAGRMLGDGLAIDPTGTTLFAPCDAELIAVPASKHAVTLRAANGAEILLHVGIDTVALGGEGFELHVRQGQTVRAGERLISFDLDLLARRAKSLLTPIVITQGGFAAVRRSQNREVKVGDFLMEIAPAQSLDEARTANASPPTAARIVSRRIAVPFEHGIHARPAALLVSSIKSFAVDVTIEAHGRSANARSTVALMALGVRKADEIEIHASGADADAAVAVLEAAIRSEAGAGRAPAATLSTPRTPMSQVTEPDSRSIQSTPLGDGMTLRGVIASRGLAVGRAAQFSRPEIDVVEGGAGVSYESGELDRARAAVTARLRLAAESGPSAAREIVAAHLQLIDDPQLIETARAWIAKGKSAGHAWRLAIRDSVDAFRALGDSRMAERVDDLLDLESQVLFALSGQTGAPVRALPERAILIAKELLPSQIVTLDATRIAGICMAAGGPTSHVAILAAAMGIPALVAIGPAVLGIPEGAPLVLDAEAGLLQVAPRQEQLEAAETQLAARLERRATEQAAAQRECRTADGVRIEVLANVGSIAEAQAAVRNGAEGCGLLRTEFLFLDRKTPPDEVEQADQYQRIADAFAGRPLTIRTLDIGGDKPIPYLPLPREDNPALGLRGVRTSLWSPELLREQLRAVLRVRPAEQCRILLPMITDPAEIRAVRGMLEDVRQELGHRAKTALGAMIETPASAVIADRIAREADFLSIGTNDLTQYTLAMDRGHPELAARLDALHPAVLRLIAGTVAAARVHGRHVAVCGGLASEPAAAPILIGLGVNELSAVPSVVPRLKALIATLSMNDCVRIARQALEQETAEEVRLLAVQSISSLDAVKVAQ